MGRHRTLEKYANLDGADNILTEGGEFLIQGFLNRCQRLLPDNYLLWCSVFSRELKETISQLSGSKLAFAPANDIVKEIIPLLSRKENGFPLIFDSCPDLAGSFLATVKSFKEAGAYDCDKVFIISHESSDEIEKRLLSSGIKKENIINFMREYSRHLSLRFEQYARENHKEIALHLKEIFKTEPQSYIIHKIDAYLYYWMIECYLKEQSDKARDANYFMAMARLSSGQGNYQKADEAVDYLIPLNRNIETSTLKRVSLVLTYHCNLRCKHCWIYDKDSFQTHKMDEHVIETELTAEEIGTIIRKSKLLQKSNITLTGGEIFIRKDLSKILDAFADAGVGFELFTNGTFPERLSALLSNRKIRDFTKCVILSFDGDRQTHDLIRGQGVFDKLQKSIDILHSNGVKVRVDTVIMEQNQDRLRVITQLVNELGCSDHDFNLHVRGGRYWRPADIRYIRSYLYDNTYFRILEEDKYTGAGCLAGITRCSIMPNGMVEACSTSKVFGHFILGNLRDYDFDFDSLWVSDAAEKVRNHLRVCPGCANHCERG